MEIQLDGGKAYGQIACILALVKEGITEGIFFCVLWLDELTPENGPAGLDLIPFPMFSYERAIGFQNKRAHVVHRDMVKVDYITKPAFILPASCDSEDLLRDRRTDCFNTRFLVVDYFFFYRKYHVGFHEFLAEKTVEFPQNQRKVLPFLLVNCGEEQVHSQTLPEFITSNYEYEGNLAVRDIELVREESDISDTEGMNQEEL